jgi:two-component sensor histidine kinase
MAVNRRWARPRTSRVLSIRAYLALLALAVLLPLLLLAGVLIWRGADAETARIEQVIAATARGALTALTREIVGLEETAQALETSPSLAEGDLAAFQRQITDLGRAQGVAIVLRDAAGNLLAGPLSVRADAGGTAPSLTEAAAEAMQRRQPVVTGYLGGQQGEAPGFAVLLPIHEGAAMRAVLHLTVPAQRLRALLQSLSAGSEWRLAILDRTGIVLARSDDRGDAIGRMTVLARALPEGATPVAGRGTDDDGRTVAFQAMAAPHGWTLVTALVAEKIDGPRRRALGSMAITAAVLVTTALIASRQIAARLARAVHGLAASGTALDRGAVVRIAPSGIREIDEVAAALTGAGDRLRANAAAGGATAARQRLILHELNHRVKNTLAMVQALAVLAARSATDVTTYRDRLTERLHGLARTQSLLTDADWTGAKLEDILRAELGMYQDAPHQDGPPGLSRQPDDQRPGTPRIRIEGPPVQLPAPHVVPFGMLVHELATNAAKYGALSSPAGRLTVSWSLGADPPRLDFVWEESGGPEVKEPAKKGFGTQMIERGLARQLQAKVRTEWRPEGVLFRLGMGLAPVPAELGAPGRA